MLSLRISYATILPHADKCVKRDSSVLFVKYLRAWADFTLIKDDILLFFHYCPLNFPLAFSLCIFL